MHDDLKLSFQRWKREIEFKLCSRTRRTVVGGIVYHRDGCAARELAWLQNTEWGIFESFFDAHMVDGVREAPSYKTYTL